MMRTAPQTSSTAMLRMKKYVGTMKSVDDSRKPRRLATAISRTAKTAMGTRQPSTSGTAEVTAAIRRYLSDDAYRKRVNRARGFPPRRPGERKRPEYRGPPVEGADLIPLNPHYGMLSDAEFQRLLHGPRDPERQRQWKEELGGRSIVEYVKDIRTQLEAERRRKARRRHSRTTRP